MTIGEGDVGDIVCVCVFESVCVCLCATQYHNLLILVHGHEYLPFFVSVSTTFFHVTLHDFQSNVYINTRYLSYV